MTDKRKLLRGDRKLREAAIVRPSKGLPPKRSSDGLEFECPYCGRKWFVVGSHTNGRLTSSHGRAAGFVASAANNHTSTCAGATPEERRAIARLDIVRWQRNPPVQTITLNHEHPGYGNSPIWPTQTHTDGR